MVDKTVGHVDGHWVAGHWGTPPGKELHVGSQGDLFIFLWKKEDLFIFLWKKEASYLLVGKFGGSWKFWESS